MPGLLPRERYGRDMGLPSKGEGLEDMGLRVRSRSHALAPS
jgi:hypothetical protein